MPSRNVRVNPYGDTMRRCTLCMEWFEQSSEFFHQRPNLGFYSRCRPCVAARASELRATRRALSPRLGRRFGLEIEYTCGGQNVYDVTEKLIAELQQRGITARREEYGHATRRHWKIVPDGSVSYGMELVSPILQGEAGFEAVRKVSAALIAAGCRVDTSAGLHVHHEVRGIDVGAFQRLVRGWRNCQPAIDALVTRSRRGTQNTYCQPLNDRDIRDVDAIRRMENGHLRDMLGDPRDSHRYRTLNFRAFPLHGTVEVRQHQGTISGAKMVAWVKFGQALIDYSIRSTEDLDYSCPFELLGELNLSGHLDEGTTQFLRGRAIRLGATLPDEALAASAIAAVEELEPSALAGEALSSAISRLAETFNARFTVQPAPSTPDGIDASANVGALQNLVNGSQTVTMQINNLTAIQDQMMRNLVTAAIPHPSMEGPF